MLYLCTPKYLIDRVSSLLYQFQLTFLSVLVRSVTQFLDKCSVDQVLMYFSLTFTMRSLKLIVFVTDSFETFGYNDIVRTKDVTPYSLFGDFLLLQMPKVDSMMSDDILMLYEDEGDNYNYEKGKFSEIQFVWNEADRTLNIAPRKGSYKGMLQHRRFHIVLVDANSGAGDQPMQASKSVEYDGKAVKIQL